MYEEKDLYERIEQLMCDGQRHQKIVALYVLANSQNREHLDASDPELQYWVLTNYCYQYYPLWRSPDADPDSPTLSFERVEPLEDKKERLRDFHLLLAMFDGMTKEYSAPSKDAFSCPSSTKIQRRRKFCPK
ncbi:hypothetical protein P4V54_28235 [Brevibacillus nitrificans]|uniref:DUF5724 domain-containing protein n=1 Tax=Brevibacillus nitrificans TaxID=651560 RepID=UPI002E2028D8|nr:hypothetical protein [Brevibacillus nitrificans]